MIDDYAQAMELMQKTEDQLPIPVRLGSPVKRTLWPGPDDLGRHSVTSGIESVGPDVKQTGLPLPGSRTDF